jgi:hypothetical protein
MNPVSEKFRAPVADAAGAVIERSLALYPEREITVYRSYPAEQPLTVIRYIWKMPIRNHRKRRRGD